MAVMEEPFSRRDLLLYGCVAVGTWIAAQAMLFYQSLDEVYRDSRAPAAAVIQPGWGAQQIGEYLATTGLVPSSWHFLTATWEERSLHRLQAGEYDATRPLSPRDWAHTLRSGRRLRHRVTFPEGWTSRQMANQLERRGLVSARAFLRAITQPELLAAAGVPSGQGEGYLFPETYTFEKPVSATGAARVLLAEFSCRATELGVDRPEQVILASIIEKEARNAEDMKKVSTVFQNRLRKGWPLESDATVVYALQSAGRLTTPLDTAFPSAYNTYAHPGLPPGAICNPGRTALEAAVRPATGEWLFFLSDPEGNFHFSRSHRQHVLIKRQLRRESSTAE